MRRCSAVEAGNARWQLFEHPTAQIEGGWPSERCAPGYYAFCVFASVCDSLPPIEYEVCADVPKTLPQRRKGHQLEAPRDEVGRTATGSETTKLEAAPRKSDIHSRLCSRNRLPTFQHPTNLTSSSTFLLPPLSLAGAVALYLCSSHLHTQPCPPNSLPTVISKRNNSSS